MSEPFATLVDVFQHAVQRYPTNHLFGIKRGGRYQWLTYAEIGEEVDQLRAGLSQLGVDRGSSVAIIANNRPEWAIGAYATYSLGANWVPMYEAQIASDWRYILEDSQAKVLFVPNSSIKEKTLPYLEELPHLEHIITLDGSALQPKTFKWLQQLGRGTPTPPRKVTPEEVCGILYTSGTTGKPKGVVLTHHNIVANLNAVHQVFPLDEHDISLSFLPWAHCFGQTAELHTLLSFGAAIGIAESPQTIVQNLAEVRPTILVSVPRIFNRIYDGVHRKMAQESWLKRSLFARTLKVASQIRRQEAHQATPVTISLQHKVLDKVVAQKIRDRFGGRLRYAISGGAALSVEIAEFIDNLGIMVYEGYGLTETSPIVSTNYPGERRIGSIGKALPGVRVVVMPNEIAPEGQGELVVYGPNVMRGYHNLPEENEKVFTPDGGFRTGDMGRIDADGFIWITGRIKEQYKLENGKYVVPAPLEERLKLSPYIANIMLDGTNRPFNVAIIAVEMENLTTFAENARIDAPNPTALLATPEVTRLIEGEIAKYGEDFKGYERPRAFHLVAEDFSTDNDLLTPSLKVKRRNVIARYRAEIDALYANT